MNMNKIFFSLTLILFISLFARTSLASVSNTSEIRVAFFHRICGISDRTSIDWDLIAQTLTSYKFNVCMIPISSSVLSPAYTNWTDLKICINQSINACHKYGMEAHILFGMLGGSTVEGMKAVDSSGNTYQWYDPCKNLTRETIKNITIEMTRDFDIDGINFDYIRYDENADISFSDECKAQFAQWLSDQGKAPITDWPGPFKRYGTREYDFREWRIIPVTNLVKDVREWALAYKPNLEFSASVYTYWYGLPGDGLRYGIGQDPADWISKGYLDFVNPMIYTGDIQRLKDFSTMDINYFTGGPEGKIPFAPFLCDDPGCNVGSGYPTTDIFSSQISYTRNVSDGFLIWRYGGPGQGNTGDALTDIRTYLNKINETNPNGWFDTFSLSNVRVENIDDTSVSVKWSTTLPTNSTVEYNTSQLFVAVKKTTTRLNYLDMEHVTGKTSSDSSNVTEHSITLTGLQKGIIYYYRVQSGDNFELLSSKIYNFSIGSLIYSINITGTVKDYDTGLPITGASVTCGSYTDTTNSTGGYLIKMFSYAPSSCSLIITKPGYVANSSSFSFLENRTYVNDDVVLNKIRYKVYGSLTNNTSAIQGTVIAYQGNNLITSNQTDSSGNYAISLLPGTYDIQYNLTNFLPSYYIKILSVDVINSDIYNMIKSVTGNEKNITITFNIADPKMVQIQSNGMPSRISQNSTLIKNVSSLANLKNNSWFYDDSTKMLNTIITPTPVPLCGNNICEDAEIDDTDLYYCPIGMLGYWKFDESSGSTATDSSSYEHTGTLVGNPTWTTGCVHGNCLSFDGIDDRVIINNFGNFSKGFSVESWFNMKQSSTRQRPFSSNAFSTCYIDSGSTSFNCFLGDGVNYGGGLGASSWSYNSWTHFAMTYNVSTGKQTIYRNGTAIISSTYNRQMKMKNGFAISSLYWGTSGFEDPFYGMIDDFAIYNRELTPQEVNQHYQNGVS